jgi:S-adenosylmethionine:tRNA ribosyltransferase-isomerase
MHSKKPLMDTLHSIGTIPLPPYIKEHEQDTSRYQTVYAKNEGSSAAPTAGLHFTNQLLEKAQEKGIEIAYVTLHIGLGTFKPVEAESIYDHKMHTEYYEISEANAKIISNAKHDGRRVVCVGTTSARVLETVATNHGEIKESSGYSDIFIYPGYQFKAVDALITNFHLPKSTLLMMISAFAGLELTRHAYQEAVEKHYRFFSFGDSMFLYR